MLRATSLFESSLIRIERVDHPPEADHIDPKEEVSLQYSINMMERGSFSIRDRARLMHVTAEQLFLTIPGRIHAYVHDEHDHAPTDVCVAVCFTDAARDDVAGLVDTLRDRPPVVPVTNRTAYVRNRLIARLAANVDDPLAQDVTAIELLEAALEIRETHRYRPAQLDWYARRIDAARRRLDDDFASDHTLSALSRDAGMSAFHFARVFRELTGTPPHRYLLRRRLAAAAGHLREGRSVTDTCFAAGFHSLSHFIHAFRRQFGVSPSRLDQTR